MSSVYDVIRRREIPVVIAAILVVLTSLGSYFGGTAMQPIADFIAVSKNWAVIIMAFTIGLALVRMLQYELSCIQKREHWWGFSAWTILMTFVTFFAAFIPPFLNNLPYNFILLTIVGYGDGTLWSFVLWSIVAASSRAFRIRSLEMFVLVMIYLLWIIYYIPYDLIPGLRDVAWFTQNTLLIFGNRGFLLVEALAILGVCFRTMIGKQRGYFR